MEFVIGQVGLLSLALDMIPSHSYKWDCHKIILRSAEKC